MKEKILQELIERINEDGYIYTPISLCNEMLSSIKEYNNKSILVIRNIEFVYSLYNLGVDMNNVYYSSSCDIKKSVAIQLGISENKVLDLQYNNKEINLGQEENMKFDIIVQNPPYNPGRLWEKFVLKAIDLLKDDGQMVAIHPEKWRHDNKNKTFKTIKNNISELHIKKNTAFIGVGTDTDWYVYNKNHNDNLTIYRFDNTIEKIKNTDIDRIHAFRYDSIPYSILNKITKENYNNGASRKDGTAKSYEHVENGKYRICGGRGNNTGWCDGNFNLTNEYLDTMTYDKIVMSYVRRPRAKFFKKEENIGVNVGIVINMTDIKTNPDSVLVLINSKMVWSMFIAMNDYHKGEKHFKSWFLQTLNIENCYFKTEEEMYKHFNITEEEIEWIINCDYK